MQQNSEFTAQFSPRLNSGVASEPRPSTIAISKQLGAKNLFVDSPLTLFYRNSVYSTTRLQQHYLTMGTIGSIGFPPEYLHYAAMSKNSEFTVRFSPRLNAGVASEPRPSTIAISKQLGAENLFVDSPLTLVYRNRVSETTSLIETAILVKKL